MISPFKIPGMMVNLNLVTNEIAEFLLLLQQNMRGKGISPKDAPVIEMKLKEAENILRMIGADEDNPIPIVNAKIAWPKGA